MATYLAGKEILITRQEGDNADVIITVPSALDLSGTVSVIFQVVDRKDTYIVFEKTTDNGITIVGQTITVPIIPEDTTGKSGVYKWELEITKEATYGIVTVAKGDFKIVKQIIE